MTVTLEALLEASARLHDGRLCPRQVLGVRMSLLAGRLLGIELPQREKRVLAIVETYGCAADGVAVGANCWIGRRTMRIVDHGKVAATFVDTATGRAIRIRPHHLARERAGLYAPGAPSRWHAQLIGYQHMPDDELLEWNEVTLTIDLKMLLGRAGERVTCSLCGEEVLDQREIRIADQVLCRSCAGDAYYRPVSRYHEWVSREAASAGV